MDRLIKRSEAKAIYSIPDRVLDRLCHMEDGPAFKFQVGGHWYFKVEALEAELNKMERRI